MENGLKIARVRAKMTQSEAAEALGLSLSGYRKKEQGDRGLGDDFIRRACEAFGVSADDVLSKLNEEDAKGIAGKGEIDPEKLSSFVAQSRNILSSLSELDAKSLILSLIEAARKS